MAGGNGSTTTGKGKRGKTPGQDTQRVVKLELLCDILDAEHLRNSHRLGELDVALKEEEDRKREWLADYRERVKPLKEERDPLAAKVLSRKEMRPVECVEDAIFERNVIVTKRRDTGEQLHERPMEPDERERMAQGQLPWGSVAELPEKPENDITEDPPRPAA